jgi:uncharacterized protein (DUF2235 family)
MILCFFFEGTGGGVSGNFTNVSRLFGVCRETDAQKRHLESGPGTHFGAYVRGAIHGHDWWLVFRGARRWFEANFRPARPSAEAARVFVFGFSRGALIARHFSAWLEKLDVKVAYMGLWDTVDATLGIDVSETCPANVDSARHAVSRDEKRRFYGYVPLLPAKEPGARQKVEELVFPGYHSDVGGYYEDNHVIADAALEWVTEGAMRSGMLIDEERLRRMYHPQGTAAKVHDSTGEFSNLWGALGGAARTLKALAFHPLCRICEAVL